ncbi:hypothetical protein MBELCI_3108 [Limimaricola cinnabarinus LL-001]|uniref:Uncharacterized protein n=1 Tax=Limimaricola cinnabarinus LL-001 TaxID=1337093 RepID=U2YNX4_9RHOB|nr:hypothetical protein MBELCI_3108 [Limimaricola cinnabarinus LL-001]
MAVAAQDNARTIRRAKGRSDLGDLVIAGSERQLLPGMM